MSFPSTLTPPSRDRADHRGLQKLDVLRQARVQERLATIGEQLESSKHNTTDGEGSALLRGGARHGSAGIMPVNGSVGGFVGAAGPLGTSATMAGGVNGGAGRVVDAVQAQVYTCGS